MNSKQKYTFKILQISILIILTLLLGNFNSFAKTDSENSENFNPAPFILHHILDGHSWELMHGVVVHLPVIVYTSEKGLDIFSSSNFYDENGNTQNYNGYKLDHEHITLEDGTPVLDISITKNVLFLFINSFLLLFIFFKVTNGYKKNKGNAPSGIQSFFEPIIIYVRDEIVKPNIGPKYEKYLPYMLTLFFFIWFGNLLGLLPGAANLSGNIAVTLTLAVLTFIITNINGNKDYWKHVFNTPGVPLMLKPIIIPLEIVGLFTKPFSLMIRLFVAISAGHIVILSLLCMTFIFHSYMVGIASSLLVTFINLIELLVATIQAYVFTMFSSMYIGMAIAEHHHDEEGGHH